MADVNGVQADNPAKELAQSLQVPLEAIANLHYLIDHAVEKPDELRRLREMEEGLFRAVVELLRPHLGNTPHRTRRAENGEDSSA